MAEEEVVVEKKSKKGWIIGVVATVAIGMLVCAGLFGAGNGEGSWTENALAKLGWDDNDGGEVEEPYAPPPPVRIETPPPPAPVAAAPAPVAEPVHVFSVSNNDRFEIAGKPAVAIQLDDTETINTWELVYIRGVDLYEVKTANDGVLEVVATGPDQPVDLNLVKKVIGHDERNPLKLPNGAEAWVHLMSAKANKVAKK